MMSRRNNGRFHGNGMVLLWAEGEKHVSLADIVLIAQGFLC